MKTHYSSDDRAKELYDKCKEKDDLKTDFEDFYAIGWPSVWVTKEEVKEMFPDKQEQALDELVAQAQELNMGYEIGPDFKCYWDDSRVTEPLKTEIH